MRHVIWRQCSVCAQSTARGSPDTVSNVHHEMVTPLEWSELYYSISHTETLKTSKVCMMGNMRITGKPQNTLHEVCITLPKAGYTLFTFHECYSQNTPQNKKHSLRTFCISREFRVLLMPQKKKPGNPLSFHTNANPGTKCCEMRKKWREIPRFTLFIFHILLPFSRILR